MTRELDPRDVLADLFGGPEFDHEILDADRAASIVIEYLRDAGFEIVDQAKQQPPEMGGAA